jgi:hypothetical protein
MTEPFGHWNAFWKPSLLERVPMTRQRRGAWESKSCVSSAFVFLKEGLRGVEKVAEDAARRRG